MTTAFDDRCPRWTGDTWHQRPCGRPVKRRGLCGIHAAADERAQANATARDAADRARDDQARRCREAASDLSQALGFDVSTTFTLGGQPVVTLSPANAERLILRLRNPEGATS